MSEDIVDKLRAISDRMFGWQLRELGAEAANEIERLRKVEEAALFWSAHVRIDDLPERARKPYARFINIVNRGETNPAPPEQS